VADLSISMTAPFLGFVGSPLTYALSVSNQGPDAATGVTVVDDLPAGVDFNSASSTQGLCSLVGHSVRCSLGAVASGGFAAITIAAIPSGSELFFLSNFAMVTGNEPDPTNSDNTASASTLVLPDPLGLLGFLFGF
jgi:uncharacterized repeat protein (TIGR01451 family)